MILPRLDDPEHQRLRSMLVGDFTLRRAESMRPLVQELVDDCLDKMLSRGAPADIARDFSLAVPSLVTARLLGVPLEDLPEFHRTTTLFVDSRTPDAQKGASWGALYAYMQQLLERKRHEPGDDLMSRLVRDYVATGQLSPETAAMDGLVILGAGIETTASVLSLGTVLLLQHPQVYARLGQTTDKGVIANVVEEMMRYLPALQALVERIAIDDFTLGGQSIRAGEFVVLNLPAGNWDPNFVDDPEAFNFDRNARRHLGFGHGAHHCLGHHLARVEIQAAFATLAHRIPTLRLEVSADELKYTSHAATYTVEELPVSW
jgi:cytochrome P450